MKSLPAFDDFDMKQAETILFGNKTTDARHFTNFSLRHATGNPNAKNDGDLQNCGEPDESDVLHWSEQPGHGRSLVDPDRYF